MSELEFDSLCISLCAPNDSQWLAELCGSSWFSNDPCEAHNYRLQIVLNISQFIILANIIHEPGTR